MVMTLKSDTLKVVSMVITWWIVFFCPVLTINAIMVEVSRPFLLLFMTQDKGTC